MSDFLHNPNPVTAVVNTPTGSMVVQQESSDFFHPTEEQQQEQAELAAKQVQEQAELNEKHLEEAKVETEVEQPDTTPQEPPAYRASTVDGEKAAVEDLFAKHQITEEERDARFAEIDKIAADIESGETQAAASSDSEVVTEDTGTVTEEPPTENDPPVIQLG